MFACGGLYGGGVGLKLPDDVALIKATCAVLLQRMEEMKLTKKIRGHSAGALVSRMFEDNPDLFHGFVSDVQRVSGICQDIRSSDPAKAVHN